MKQHFFFIKEDQPRGMAVTIFISFPQPPTYSKWNLLKRSIGVPLIMPKIPVIPVKTQMERFVLVQSNQNIWDHPWRRSTLIGRTGPTKICCSIFTNPAWLVSRFHLCREFGAGIKKMVIAIPLAWPSIIGKCTVVPFTSFSPAGLWPVVLA